MRAFALEALEGARAVVPVRDARTLVAVAGTSTTVQALSLGLESHDSEAIHRTRLTLAEASRVLEELARMTTPERSALPVMPPGRGDVIVGGAAILVTAMRALGFDEALVSETDILDGLAFDRLASL
jgi:exopolyphosphatase/guanosine-5'-triphosphate,3'-diphosphate pyrophosphatase